MYLNCIKPKSHIFAIVLYTIIYIFFPTNNSTIDAYNYAANVKWGHDLFFPHHLLYNLPAWLIHSLFQTFYFDLDVLQLMKTINAIAAGLVLFVFFKILKQLSVQKNTITALLLVAGSSFGFFRFATENEAYIIPLLMSVISSYYFLLFVNKKLNQYILVSGFFASMACLFHQIHVFWFIGIFIGLISFKYKTKPLVFFLLPGFLIPVVYFLAFRFGNNEFIKADNLLIYVLYDYFYGTANVEFSFDNIILGFINLIRSYVQVHGIILILIKKYVFLIIVILLSGFFFIKALLSLKSIQKNKQLNRNFLLVHVIIFILQFAFAIFAGGNAEFMVMLPILSLFVAITYVELNNTFYKNLGIAILIWNMSFAVLPNYIFDYKNNKQIINYIETKTKHYFILSEDVLIQNKIYYQTGIPWNGYILKSPAGNKINGKNLSELSLQIDSLLKQNKTIYTDCIDEPVVFNRAAYLSANENNLFFKNYHNIKVDSFQTFAGTKYINVIK
ncbi:MAG: hypothetical protein B6I20_12490 [Bacteroidetes bacterium 4572_117]|nr:MAG: hypothetical protein B6I20_12490 [Bacteroidetes bacterium 4572_117]